MITTLLLRGTKTKYRDLHKAFTKSQRGGGPFLITHWSCCPPGSVLCADRLTRWSGPSNGLCDRNYLDT